MERHIGMDVHAVSCTLAVISVRSFAGVQVAIELAIPNSAIDDEDAIVAAFRSASISISTLGPDSSVDTSSACPPAIRPMRVSNSEPKQVEGRYATQE